MQELAMEPRTKKLNDDRFLRGRLSNENNLPKSNFLRSDDLSSKDRVIEERKLWTREMETLLHPKVICTLNVKNPAYLEVIKTEDQKQHLIVSSFDPWGKYSALKEINDIDKMFSKYQKPQGFPINSLTKNIAWPNDITKVPKRLFGKEGFLVGTGFFIPGSSTGEVAFIDINSGEKQKLTKDKDGWFYHKAMTYDLFDKGNPGVLTARSNKSMNPFKKAEGELVWLQRPERAGEPWKEHILMKGPDANFDIGYIGNKKVIAACETFNNKIDIIWDDDGKIHNRTIDLKINTPFDVEFVDLNKSGKPQLLVTNHTQKGSVFVYEIPDDFRNGVWKKHEICSNIEARNIVPGTLAPGKAIPFYPTKERNGKPSIIVSGDGSGMVHLLVPKSQNDPNNWEYAQSIIHKDKCTIGKIKVYMDNNGFAKIFVPLYEKNKILVFGYDEENFLKNMTSTRLRN